MTNRGERVDEGLTNPGEMRARIRAFDWTRTPLGPPEHWPASLRMAVDLCLDSRFPMLVRWGEELITFYNDACIPILGQKHPGALGSPSLSPAVWGEPEVHAVIEPLLRGVLARGESTWSNDQPVVVRRHGFAEEVYFTFAYSPLWVEPRVEPGVVGGIFTVVSETTRKVLSERRLRVLRELSSRLLAQSTAPATHAAALAVLGEASRDVPFSLLYLLDASGTSVTLAGLTGPLPAEAAPRRFAVHAPNAPWPLARAWTGPTQVEAGQWGTWAGQLPGGPWPEPSQQILLLPLFSGGARTPSGFLVAGTSPRLVLDESYRDFLTQLADHLTAALTRVRAHEEERRSAETLAELDRTQQEQWQVTRTLAENATSALYMTDGAGRCTYMNPAAERMTGHALVDIQGQRLHGLVHPERGPLACPGGCALERLLLGGDGPGGGSHEDRFTRLTGEVLPVALAASPIRSQGQRVGCVLEARDLSAQRRAEAALQEAQRRKDEFLAMLAHELRNPMAPLRAALKLIAARTPLDDKGRHAVEVIERQTSHLARLVDDLLDVSRITRGRIELRKELVELPAVVERALQSVQPLLDERRHEVSVTLPRRPPRTLGDAMRLEQIIVNLLTNAAKYTEPGGTLRVSLERVGPDAEVCVKDTGIGLAPEMLPRVFGLFEQAERPLDRSQGGLGIGLTLVKNLVELHGGTVEARSEGLGRGSEFIVRLPLAEDAVAPRAPPEPLVESLPPGARRILVVDDNLDAADTLAELLQTWEHTVWQAHDGLAALKAVEEHRPDLVLLDIGLPGMDGYEVARRLRANPRGEQLTLVALTGYGQASDRSRAMEAGFDRHFVKPVDIDGLQKFIDQRPPRAPRPER